MSYNLRTNAKGRQGRRSNVNVIVTSSEADPESMVAGIVAAASLHEKGEHRQKKIKGRRRVGR